MCYEYSLVMHLPLRKVPAQSLDRLIGYDNLYGFFPIAVVVLPNYSRVLAIFLDLCVPAKKYAHAKLTLDILK
jgi:hypothetical protein